MYNCLAFSQPSSNESARSSSVIAFSRNERTHPNFVCSREKSTFFVKTANWPPLQVFSGALGLVFVDTKTRLGYFCSLVWLRSDSHSVRRFEVFLELVFTLIAFDKKGNAVQVQTGLRFFDLSRKRATSSQSTCIRDDLRFRSTFTIARL